MTPKTTKTSLGMMALAAVFASTLMATPARSEETVAATVNGEKILKKDVTTAMKALPAPAEQKDKLYPMVVEQMINEKLIDIDIAKKKVESDKDFLARKAAMEAQLVKTYYLEKFLKDRVSDGAVKSEYDKFRRDNKGKQEVHARNILVNSEEEAKKVIADLDKGAKFEELAKKRSSGPTAKTGGDVGWFTKGEIIPEFSDAAFKLKPGTYTKTPVKTQFGWHVIYVEAMRERNVPEFKVVEQNIRAKLGQEAIGELVQGLRTKAEIKRFDDNGKPIEEPQKN